MVLINNTSNLRFYYKNNITKWARINYIRLKSTAAPKTKTYSHSILSPNTKFPARSSNAIKEQIQKVIK